MVDDGRHAAKVRPGVADGAADHPRRIARGRRCSTSSCSSCRWPCCSASSCRGCPAICLLGGSYLCFEGAEKLYERLSGLHQGGEAGLAVERGRRPSRRWSTEGRPHRPHPLGGDHGDRPGRGDRGAARLAGGQRLIIVALLITALVCGVRIALIVKMDDVRLLLAQWSSRAARSAAQDGIGARDTGTAGAHLRGRGRRDDLGGRTHHLAGLDELGWHAP
ncbi:MAG: hypothetical protein R2734_05315 [Nocardioides sp.]